MSELNISKNDISIAGEFYMAYILAKYGFKVSPTLGRTEVFDLFAQNPKGKNLTISVKTKYLSKSIEIPINKKAETRIDESLFYAFVRLNMPDGEPEFWIVPSRIVAKATIDSDKVWMDKPKRDGSKHKEVALRIFALGTHRLYPGDWEEQLEHFKSNIESLKDLK
ncbi:hypothetical protein LCGC14_0668080 [marine sediment metagenome]|uniref:PD(D/E)XK endonuclease domain-containing protein n=1 Tax=marine sediment metagenome TaxID=412755 RepID=A0A0F9RBY1_9ZZZZ